jgi:CII-binding regulator of phage lambda lysogenization HflD
VGGPAMREKQDWKIINISKETKNKIKQNAKSVGYTIPEYLAWIVDDKKIDVSNIDNKKSWLLHGFDAATIQTIKNNAANENKSVANYIKSLLLLERTVIRQDRVKADLKRQVKKGIERLFKELDSSES